MTVISKPISLTGLKPVGPSVHFNGGRGPNPGEIHEANQAVLNAFQRKDIKLLLDMICDTMNRGRSPLFYIKGYEGIKHEPDVAKIEDAHKSAQAALLELAEDQSTRRQIISWLDGQFHSQQNKFSPKFLTKLFLNDAERETLDTLVSKWGL